MKKTFKSFITEDAFLSPINRKTMVVLYITTTHKTVRYICICLMCFLHLTMIHFPEKKKRLNVSARQ